MNNLNLLDIRGFLLKFCEGHLTDYECDQFALVYCWRFQVLAVSSGGLSNG